MFRTVSGGADGAERDRIGRGARRGRARPRSAARAVDDGAGIRRGGVPLHDRHPVSRPVGPAAAVRSRLHSPGPHRRRVHRDCRTDRRGRRATSPSPAQLLARADWRTSAVDPGDEYRRRMSTLERGPGRGRAAAPPRLQPRLAVFAASLRWSPGWRLVGNRDRRRRGSSLPARRFVVLLVAHARVLNRNERAERAHAALRARPRRLTGRGRAAAPTARASSTGHPYARDLDLFGPASLFQLLNTARTEAGEDDARGVAGADPPAWRDPGAAGGGGRTAPRLDLREDLAVLAAEAHVGRTGALAALGGVRRRPGLPALPRWALGASAAPPPCC